MYLLNDDRISKERAEGPSGALGISPFFIDNLGPTYYYFTLGPLFRRWSSKKRDWEVGELRPGESEIKVAPTDYLLVQSQERFRCSLACLGVFGPSSQLLRRGLSIRNSPFIDPFFPGDKPGYLEIGLANEITESVPIRLGDPIGKICFFNVSDTYPIQPPTSEQTRKDYRRRSSSEPPMHVDPPTYDDHPVKGYKEVEEYGRSNREND